MRSPLAVFKRRDYLWLLATPIYAILGTLKHEASHALAAMAEGARIIEFVFLPSFQPGRGFLWGYVSWDGQVSWFATAAPYFCDLVSYLIVFPICLAVTFKRKWVWINLVGFGLLGPLLDSLYNYGGGFYRQNDVANLQQVLTPWAVHGFFLGSMALYVVGILVVLCHSETVKYALSEKR